VTNPGRFRRRLQNPRRGPNGHDESEGHKPQEGRRSRERPAILFCVRDPEVEPDEAACVLGRQPHEGRTGEGRASARRERTLKGKRPRRATRSVFSLNRWTEWRTLARSKTLKAVKNAKRGATLETAYDCDGGRKLCRVTPRADPAWNKAGRLGADEGVRRLREPEDAGGREMQARPI